LNTNCTEKDYSELGESEFVCCSHHLTSFAVGEPFEVATGRYEKTIACLVSLNICCVVCMIIGLIFDVKKVLIFDKRGGSPVLASSDGAAAVEQSSAAMEMSSNVAPGG